MHVSRRSWLASAAASLAAVVKPLAAAPPPAIKTDRDGRVSVRAFGAVGDGRVDDTAAIQAAIDTVEAGRGSVFFPAGRYLISRSILLPSFVMIEGEGVGSILDNQHAALASPQMINKDPAALIMAVVRNMVFRGGTHGIKIDVTSEIAGLRFEGCTFELQTDKNFEANKLLQTSMFINCLFDGAPYGLYVKSFTSNANNFINCHFTNHAQSHVFLNSAEINNFIGCRFEGGGVLKRSTIVLHDARNVTFSGCYFEATHQYLLTETKSSGSVSGVSTNETD